MRRQRFHFIPMFENGKVVGQRCARPSIADFVRGIRSDVSPGDGRTKTHGDSEVAVGWHRSVVVSRADYSPRFSLRFARRLIFQRRLIFCLVVSFMILAFPPGVITGQPPPLRSRAE